MLGTLTARLLRSGLALLLCLSTAGAALGGATVSAAVQNVEAADLPGFSTLPNEAELVAWASGQIQADGVATLLVERITIEPGSGLDPAAGPFIVIVEQGSLLYEDDLGLEAEVASGAAQYFAPGEGDTLANGGEEPAIVVRAALIPGGPTNGDSGPDDDEAGDETGDTEGNGDDGNDAGNGDDDGEGDGPGDDAPVQPRGGDSGNGLSARQVGGINALILQTVDTPDEVVISLTGNGFAPDEVAILRGGTLVIENAGDTDCVFHIADLDLQIELDQGDIEQVTIDGPAGDYAWECIDASDDVIGDGLLTIVDPGAGAEPEETETTEAVETSSPEPDSEDVVPNGPTGELLQASVSFDDSSELFAGSIVLQPGGVLTLEGADGSLGVIVSGGDLTVARPGRAPATLRDGRSVTLPSGTSAELTNDGDTPLLLIMAGVTGSSAADNIAPPVTPEPDEDEPRTDDESNGQEAAGLYGFFPDDSELAALGLFPTWAAFTEFTDPGSNTFWFSSPDLAADLLEEADWIQSSELRYSSDGEETSFGVVSVLGIMVDSFEDEDGAALFFGYIEDDPSGADSDLLTGLDEVLGAVEFDFGNGGTETMIVAIHTGAYVITLFASGPDLDAQALIREVAGLIFGVVG